jgi:hypothetical protein
MTQILIGASPVTFISEDTSHDAGTQYQIPLPLIGYDPTSSTPITLNWNAPTGFTSTDTSLAVTLIQNLVTAGLLTTPPS